MAEDTKKPEQEKKPAPAEAKPAAAPAAAGADAAAPSLVAGEEAIKAVKKRVKGGKHVPVGVVHIRSTFNNTMVTITDPKGAVLSWSSAGRCQFKGSRKSTAYAATVVAQEAARQAVGMGMHEAEILVEGPGAGRESAIRAIQSSGIAITCIRDVTPIPHNGCRPPKRRRV